MATDLESPEKIRSLPQVLHLEFMVNSPREEFFDWFSDFSNYASLYDHIISINPADNQPFGVGKRYVEKAYNFKWQEELFKAQIVSLSIPEYIIVKVDNPRVAGYFEFSFKAHGNATKLTILHYTGHTNPIKVLILKWGIGLLFTSRKRKAQARLKELFA